ncbi:MAG: Gldg family protein [Gemmatimonadota bacterium]|nr:Gldg family protein [Gemmatimonadota bacterium]
MIRRIGTIVRRELTGYFDHATAYILLVVFLGVNFFFFFQSAYEIGEASLRPMLGLLPWLLLFFVPAVCMRSLAEERHAGTLELVLAQPISVGEFLVGKYLGVYAFLMIALLATVGVPLGLSRGADLQAGVIFAQYVGASFLIAAMVAIGLWASSMTKNQVTAFILGVTVSFTLYVVGLEVVVLSLPASLSVLAGRLGILGHFQNVARGVIDLRDVLYFASVTAAFLSLTYFSLMRERLSKERASYNRLRLGVAGMLAFSIVAALAGGQIRGRIDLTPGKLYTLSQPTRDLVAGLDDLVTIKFFRSDELPPEIAPIRRDIDDLLRDFDSAGGTNLNLVQLDPDGDPDALAEAQTLGVPAAEFNVIGDQERSTRQGYLGVAIQYAGQTDVIPLVRRTQDLEYRLASMIRTMTEQDRPVVAILEGHGEFSGTNNMTIGVGRLAEEYSVQRLTLDTTLTAVPDSIDVIVVAGPATPFSSEEGRLVGQFLDRGGSVLLMLGGTRVDPRSRMAAPAFYPVLDSLLTSRGLGVLPAVAYDVSSNDPIPMQTAGGYVIQQYPLFPMAWPASDHPILEGDNTVSMRWVSPLFMENADSTRVTPLLVTTEYGGRFQAPASVEPDLDWNAIIDPDVLEPQVLAAAYQDDVGGRLVVVGTQAIVEDGVIQSTANGLAGLIFFQNAVDWLAQDEALISIRSKDRAPPQLLFQSAFMRDAAKWGNLAGVPLLFVLLGIVRLARRRGQQRRAYEPGGAIL